MQWLREMLGWSPRGGVHDKPDDDVYPLHDLDDTPTRRVLVARVLRFDHVLDAEMLHNSLTKLLDIGDWRKLAGRLRYKKNGRLEVRVPKRFTTERPAVTFTHDRIGDMSIRSHPTASRLHIPTDGVSIQDVPNENDMFASRPDFPASVDEMIRRDMPQLLLHVTSFSDATLVSLVWAHTVADGFGILTLLKNWSLVLAGRESEVAPVIGGREDVVLEAETAENPQNRQPLVIEPMRLTGVPLVTWLFRRVWEYLSSPALESKTIFLPKEKLDQLLRQVHKEIDEMSPPPIGTPAYFASENDVLTAWVTHTIATSESTPRPMTVAAFVNLRGRLPHTDIDTSHGRGIYMQNMLMLTFAFLGAELLSGPVGDIAVAHRRHVQEQTTESQVLSFMRNFRKDADATTAPLRVLFGAADSRPILFNNFVKADYLGTVDFGPAVVRPGRHIPAGFMTTYYYRVYSAPLSITSSFYMLGKDQNGSIWLQGNLRPREWADLHKRLNKL